VRLSAARWSASEMMAYRFSMESVSWPEIVIATCGGTPARTMSLTPLLRRSWKRRLGTLTMRQAVAQALRVSVIAWPS
jgi:hypothetical protein